MTVGIRPANMRLTHGLRTGYRTTSVATSFCVEDHIADPLMARESGAGMDAPDDLPTGSVKAFFADDNGRKFCFGFCQRTTPRPE